MSANELITKSVTELAPLIESKQVSPVEVTTALLDHAKALNPEVNAYISFREQALADARRAEDEISRGDYRGVFHGVPLALKDNLYVGGEVTTMASKIHKDFVPAEDASVVRRLRKAGAVLTGKLNMHEYAWGIDNNNPHFGSVQNPWDPAKVPGGSSGGSGAGVAAHMTYATLGTDTAGSIRIPSAACGIVGLKPTHGRVPKDGCFPLAWTLDHIGPMTKTVDDAAAMLQVIAGFDAADPTAVDTPVGDYTSNLAGDVSGLVIGVEEDYYFRDVDNEIERLVRAQIDELVSRGARVQTVKIPTLRHSEWAELATSLSEASAIHHNDLLTRADDFGADIRFLFELGELFSSVDYLQAQQVRRQLKNDFAAALSEVDVLIAPTLPVMAPDIGSSEADLNGTKVDLIDSFIRFTGPSNLTGLPAMSVPVGFNGDLPVGLQIIGRAFDERTVLNVGKSIEAGGPMGDRTPAVLR
ncbi:amidase [Dietzia maris]|uniref:amidase n=1 Tax=Dietzia maris TaxID=37915 RepID=UPI0022B36B7E|nr:amidase [Dietzia maris]MCZ4541566.1 amidase [Dietzia maris]